MAEQLYREANPWMGPTVNDIKAEAMLELLTEWGWLVPVEIDHEAAWTAYNRRLNLDGVPDDADFEPLTPNAVNELGLQEAVNAAVGIEGGDDE